MTCMYRGERLEEGGGGHASDGVQLRTSEAVMHERCSDSESVSDLDDNGEGLCGLDQEWKQKIT